MSRLLTPRRVLQHLLVLAVVLVLARLGLWQLSRLDEVQERNAALQERVEAAPVPVEDLLAGTSLGDAGLDDLEYRRVTATGTWDVEDEVLQRGRALKGSNGFDVLTPLDLDDGGRVLVRRGFVPVDVVEDGPPVAAAAPAAGTVTVTGTLEASLPQPTSGFTQRDPAGDEPLDTVFWSDLERLGPQLGDDLLPMLVRLDVDVNAPAGTLPIPPGPVTFDEGTHLSYALQWFAFSLTGAAFYAVYLRRSLRGDGSTTSVPDADEHEDAAR